LVALLTAAWGAATAAILVSVPDVPYGAFLYSEAVLTCGEGDAVYRSGEFHTEGGEALFSCLRPKLHADEKFPYALLTLLWVTFFVVAVGQCAIAGAAAVWYFEPPAARRPPLRTGLYNAVVFHSGSLAFGSLLLAIVRLARLGFHYLAHWAKKGPKNKCAESCVKCLSYALWCFEKCLKFLSRHAYIQIALLGRNFCSSARMAFNLLLRNAARIGILSLVAPFIHLLGIVGIAAGAGACGAQILQAMHPDDIQEPDVVIAVYVVIGLVVGLSVFSVFGLGVDAILQCFCADEEMHAHEGGAKCSPPLLHEFLAESAKEGERTRAALGIRRKAPPEEKGSPEGLREKDSKPEEFKLSLTA
jgi:hypothetical protein